MKKKYIAILTALVMLLTFVPTSVMATDNVAAEQIGEEGTSSVVFTDSKEQFDENREIAPPEGFTAGTPAPEKRTTKAVSNTCGKNLKWKISGNTLTVSGSGAMTEFGYGESPWYANRTSITKVVIEKGCTTIGSFAFYNFTNLASVEIADTVTAIGEGAFYKCSKLTTVTLPSVKTLEPAAFADCSNLNSFTANKLTEVSDYALQSTALKSFHFPATLKSFSGLTFFGSSIETITVATGNTVFSAKDGVIYIDGGKTLFMYPIGASRTSFVIPDTVTKVENYAFGNNKYLTDIQIPKSVTYLGEGSFMNADSLKSITIGDGVKEMGYFPFYNCDQLESVTFGSGMKTTSYQCFSDCEKLSRIDFGNSLESLDAHSFAYCNSLIEVELPANITEVGVGAFGCCENLKKFKSNGLKDIPYQCFYGCISLTDVTLNEGVKNIYRVTFTGCELLDAITLPKSVSFVHSDAFPAQTKVTCLNPLMEKYGTNGYRYLENVKINAYKNYDYAEEVLKLVNEERKAAGLGTLTLSAALTETAMKRAGECALLFSHTRPDGSNCFTANGDMFAENVAYGQTSAKGVMNSWMNSSGHKANILLKDAKTIGIGCIKHNGSYYWVQVFGTSASADKYAYPENKSIVQTVKICTETFDEAEVGNDIIWGDYAEYTYKLNVVFDNASPLTKGATTTAKVRVSNPGAAGVYAILNNSGINWTSSNENVATVSQAGEIAAVGAGTSTITAKMQHYSPSKNLTVECTKHSFQQKSINKATKSANGKINYACKYCGTTKSTVVYRPSSMKLSAKTFTYNGKVKKPTVKVINVQGKEISPDYYTVKYAEGRKNVGSYKVTVTMKDKYKATYTATFKVNPKATNISRLTKGNGKIVVKWSKRTQQVTGYQIRYSTSSSFSNYKTATVAKNKTTKTTLKNLKHNKTYYVKVRTYKTVNGVKYYSKWSNKKSVKTR